MPVLLGIIASLLIGTSDYFSRLAATKSKSVTVVATALVSGTLAAVLAAALFGGTASVRDIGFGLMSGVVSGFALMLLYQGMTIASVAVVSPTSSAFVALIPFAWGLSRGESPRTLALIGVAVTVPSLALTSFSPKLGNRARTGLLFGIGSGVLFGIGFIFLGETSPDSGLWPAGAQRASAWLAMFLLATSQRVPRFCPPDVRKFALLGGALGSLGIVAFTAGVQRGAISEVSVAASGYPAVTAVLVWTFDREHLHWWQAIGILGAIAGVSLIALA